MVFKTKRDRQGMAQSMSRVGHCIGNDAMKVFWETLKAEMYYLYLHRFLNYDSLRAVIESNIHYYNNGKFSKTAKRLRSDGVSCTAANSRVNSKTLSYRGCDKEGFEKPSKINGLRQRQTGNVCKGVRFVAVPFLLDGLMLKQYNMIIVDYFCYT